MQSRFYSVLLYIFCTCLVVDCVSKGGAKNKRGHLLFATWGTYLAAFWVELGSHRRYLDQNGCLTRENKMMVKLLDNLVIDTRCSFVYSEISNKKLEILHIYSLKYRNILCYKSGQLYRYIVQLVLIRTLETIVILTLKWSI